MRNSLYFFFIASSAYLAFKLLSVAVLHCRRQQLSNFIANKAAVV